jgi:Alpha-kinase family/von Willebrand factor type A domain
MTTAQPLTQDSYEDVDVPTSSIKIVETSHGRLRRQQRGIDKKDLQAALKHGVRTPCAPRTKGGTHDPVAKYCYNGICYVVNEGTRQEITSYAIPLELDVIPISDEALRQYHLVRDQVASHPNCWTSHSVILVDTSGSMRESDVWGCKTRLDAVWVSLALDFVAHRLETCQADARDVLSIVTMDSEPKVLMLQQPMTAVLYNKLTRIYHSDIVVPRGHGPFLPALRVASNLFGYETTSGSCVQTLMILSDGRPSDMRDKDQIMSEVERMASEFGRRLTFTAVGIGSGADFDILRGMVARAADFGSQALFNLPFSSSEALGQVFSSVASLITSTRSELSDLETLQRPPIRKEVTRESRRVASRPLQRISTSDFRIYPRNRVLRTVHRALWDDTSSRVTHYEFATADLQNQSSAHFVAIAKSAFGEGAERFAYRFYEIGRDGSSIVGKPLAAKENRVEIQASDKAKTAAQLRFVRMFCSTQQLARQLAVEFNRKLDECSRRIDCRTPRISFLDCSVYQLFESDSTVTSVLVEERLDSKGWHKWNANNGYVDGMAHPPDYVSVASLREAYTKLDAEDFRVPALHDDLSDDEDEGEYYSDEDEYDDGDYSLCSKSTARAPPAVYSASAVAQAFSHFTYWATARKRLVCDLQGVHDEQAGVLRLTDPVIHYYHPSRADRKRVHGSTDRGRKGIAMFFGTHRCGPLCHLMLRGLRHSYPDDS